jgi:hypothetical protein
MDTDYSIYTLSDPIDGSIRYVGKTKNAESRYNAHLVAIRGEGSLDKRNWVKSLRGQGLKPIFTIIEEGLSRDQAYVKEKYWIRHHIEKGANLYNQIGIKPSSQEIMRLIYRYQDLTDQAIPPNAEWKTTKATLDELATGILSTLISLPSPTIFKATDMKATNAADDEISQLRKENKKLKSLIKQIRQLTQQD